MLEHFFLLALAFFDLRGPPPSARRPAERRAKAIGPLGPAFARRSAPSEMLLRSVSNALECVETV